MGDKHGSSHVEMILSFTIFIGFSIFLMSYIQPEKKSSLDESILFSLQSKFFENTTVVMNRTFIIYNKSYCNEKCKPSSVSGNNIIFEPINETSCAYYILSSSEFSNSNIAECSNNDMYSTGSTKIETFISNKTTNSIVNNYKNNYDELKDSLGVPINVDFAIISEDYFSIERQIPDLAEVKSNIYTKAVIFSNGTIANKKFIIKIW